MTNVGNLFIRETLVEETIDDWGDRGEEESGGEERERRTEREHERVGSVGYLRDCGMASNGDIDLWDLESKGGRVGICT